MASSSSSSVSFLHLLLLFITISLQQLSSSSSSMVFLPLTHTLSKGKTPDTHHLLKTSSLHSSSRFRRQRHRREISLPLSPGSDYLLSLSLGQHPSRTIDLYMDTGSDLVWSPCALFECILCEGKPDVSPDFHPPNISSTAFVPCNSAACSAAHSALPSSDLCAISGCPLETIETGDCAAFRCPNFYYAYGDGSLVAGLRSDRLSIQSTKPTTPLLHLPNFTFGCAHTALAEPVGVAGFGRGILSLPAQLAAFSPTLGNRFSYCLISHSFDTTRLRRPSPLILGRSSVQSDDQSGEFVYTPMLDNPKHRYFYSVALEAVSVAGKRLPATRDLRRIDGEGNGGMVVDSGTTFTILPAGMYGSLSKEFDLRMGRNYERATRAEEEMGMGLCYYSDGGKAHVPKLVLHFGGNASVALPARNYFLGFDREEGGQKRKVGCLMMMNGGDDSDGSGGGPSATLGNYQQQGFEVVYDLERRRVGFARRRCAQMWDTLSRG
eukprot:TRINITY_DN80184_c0_g1_i1.p1 TRINITY_DN80184_c0_g1~~TRINITY_DN80184_c0_g1_i1.p1  ORF type:complete len:493 (-),score=51.85 TRINITY_DN80184_c0_g1_i1:407-1885(-)